MILKRTLIAVGVYYLIMDAFVCQSLWTGPTTTFQENMNALQFGDFLRQYGLTLHECMEACMARKWCLAAMYRRIYPACVLLTSTPVGMPSKYYVLMTGFERYHAESPLCGSSACSMNATCINKTVCQFKECQYPDFVPTDTTLRGNMRSVGSKILLDNGTAKDYRVCTNSGEWKQTCASSETGIQASVSSPSCLASDVTNTATFTTDSLAATAVTLATSVSEVYIITMENYPLDTCSLTGSLYFASVTVNLTSVYEIRAVHINNRQENCSTKPQKISLRMGDSADSMQQVDYQSPSGLECMFVLTSPARTQEIKVMIESDVLMDEFCSISLFANPSTLPVMSSPGIPSPGIPSTNDPANPM